MFKRFPEAYTKVLPYAQMGRCYFVQQFYTLGQAPQQACDSLNNLVKKYQC